MKKEYKQSYILKQKCINKQIFNDYAYKWAKGELQTS